MRVIFISDNFSLVQSVWREKNRIKTNKKNFKAIKKKCKRNLNYMCILACGAYVITYETISLHSLKVRKRRKKNISYDTVADGKITISLEMIFSQLDNGVFYFILFSFSVCFHCIITLHTRKKKPFTKSLLHPKGNNSNSNKCKVFFFSFITSTKKVIHNWRE